MAIYTADAQMLADEIHTLLYHSPQTQHTSPKKKKLPENYKSSRDALWGNTILFRNTNRGCTHEITEYLTHR